MKCICVIPAGHIVNGKETAKYGIFGDRKSSDGLSSRVFLVVNVNNLVICSHDFLIYQESHVSL